MLNNMPWVSLVIGLGLLVCGADFLVRGGSRIALRLGMSPLLVGLTIVALGTSSPELIVSVTAALGGNSGLALGNVVGSNIANICLILAVAALIAPLGLKSELLRRDVPVMVGATMITVLVAADGHISRFEGGLMVVMLLAYLVNSYLQQKNAETESFVRDTGPIWKNLGMLLGGCAALAVGSDLMVDGAVTIARSWGISDAVIGMTVVAVGTSLPELATSIAAVLKGHTDLAIGNVVGSNIFNCLAILGITSTISPISATDIGIQPLLVMFLITVFAVPLMLTGARICRKEGLALLCVYVCYNVSLFS